MSKIYLSGPITGLTYAAARHEWRVGFSIALERLARQNAQDAPMCLSPMRGKDALRDEAGPIGAFQSVERAITDPKGILARDTHDVRSADAVVVNVLGAERVSIGTVAEIGMAHALCKPIILVMEKQGNVHHHPFVTEPAGYWIDNLEEAAWLAFHLLTPGL